MPLRVRAATADDASSIEEIEAAADRLLIDFLRATAWPAPDAAAERLTRPGFLLIAEVDGVPAGFVHGEELGAAQAHLEQVSVLPRFARRGIGRLLVEQAKAEATARRHSELTLRTYADVPWNAPFYASCGFVETAPDTDALRRLVAVEERLGLLQHGRRVQMTAPLTATLPSL